MSLNNISLPSQLIADLYHHALVQDTARAMPVKKAVPFLGKNEKNILIVVNKDDAPYLPDNELAFLTNVLSACQLGLSDVAIVNWNNSNDKKPEALFEQLFTSKIILFDVEPSAFGLSPDIQQYAVVKGVVHQFVAAPSLSEIEKNKEAKKQLWMALKQLFSI
jgi:DNA polymerase III psi subunit